MSTGKLVAMQMMESDSYDPEALGARCDLCVLRTQRDGGPVGPELRYDSNIALVTEAPGEKEVIHKRPLVGPSGIELNESLKAIGASRQMFNIHNAICCRPPENDLEKVMLKWQRANKKREKEGLEPVPSPIECCRPRLINELWGTFGLVALGKTAYQSVTRKAKSILEIRGGPQVGYLNPVGDFVDGEMPADAPNGSQKINVLPTLHPGFVLKARRWSRAFRSDLSRAHRWFTTGTLGWVEPEITVNPSPADLEAFLARTDIDYSVDVETTVDDPTEADLRTVGIGHEHAAMVCVLKSIETGMSAYRSDEDLEIRRILKEFFADLDKVKVAHNGGYFDRMVIKNHFGVDPKPMMDTILLHRNVESELPHKLAYVGSIYTDVSAWKQNHTATEARTDKELAIYNGIDCVVTSRAATKLAEAAYLRGQNQVVQRDHRVQQMCVGLHENGMFVDRKARDVVARELLVKISKYRQEAQAFSGRPNMNPNSVPQLRDLLFTEWDLQPIDYTKLGDPSTNDECIRAMRSANRDKDQVIRFLDALRRYRKVAKEYGTYVRRLIPAGQPLDGIAWQSEDEEEEAERGLIMRDGRIRADYNAHGTTSGRLSSSNPNCFTGDTEILTARGWVRFDELPKDVPVAQYHPDKRVTWTRPTDYVEQEFDGELVHVRNQHIDLLTTPDHRCLLRHRKTGELRVFAAQDYPEDWQQINAGQLIESGGAAQVGVGLLMLIVAAQADGSWVKGTARGRLTFKFTKTRKIERLHKIIEMLGGDVTARIDHPVMNGEREQHRIEIEGRAVDEVFEYIGEDKEFGPWLLGLTPHLSALFCDEVFYWDGCFTRKNHYSSNSRNNASWVQTLLTLNGYRANLRAYQGSKNVNWQVDVTRRDYSMTTNVEKSSVLHTGKVYCVSVPSSYIIVRRNGKVMVTGNCQNWPKHLRKLIIPAPGNVIVGADADQLELRIITSIAQIQVYLEAFNDKKDPHAMTAALMFGKKFTDLVPKSDLWDKLRKIAKSIKYASFYGSGDETVHGLVTSAEDDNGNLMYPDLTLREVATLKRNWLKGIPELPHWWEETMEEYRSSGYVIDPVWGRRRDFLDGEAFNEIVNHPVQCVPGWSRVLTKNGYVPIEQLRGQEFTAWTGKRWAPARVIYRGIKELHRVYTKRGMHFTCDDDHRGKFVGREGYEWRKFVEAGQGSRFAVDLAREQEFGHPMGELDAYVAGYWVGDGSSTPDGHHAHAISFVVAHGDGPRAGAQMESKLTSWASLHNLNLRRSEQTGCFQLTCHKGGTEWLRSIGADPAWKAHTKRIPESIWRADLLARKAFLRGLLDADGYSSPDGAVSLHLCQHQLLQDTMVLARTVGIEGSISGPYASSKKGHESFRLDLNGSQTFASVQWGRECKLRTSQVGLAPRFESKRVQPDLDPTCGSDRVIKSRIKTSATPSVSPYVLARMGADDLYDHDAISSVNSRRIFTPVFTLEVDDPDHQYVVEGVISKNSAGAHIIHESTFDLLEEIPFEKWGKGTGLISQVHDALYVECPCGHEKYEAKDAEFGWCPPGCKCEANWTARTIEKHMNRKVKGLDGVLFSAKAKIGKNWGEV